MTERQEDLRRQVLDKPKIRWVDPGTPLLSPRPYLPSRYIPPHQPPALQPPQQPPVTPAQRSGLDALVQNLEAQERRQCSSAVPSSPLVPPDRRQRPMFRAARESLLDTLFQNPTEVQERWHTRPVAPFPYQSSASQWRKELTPGPAPETALESARASGLDTIVRDLMDIQVRRESRHASPPSANLVAALERTASSAPSNLLHLCPHCHGSASMELPVLTPPPFLKRKRTLPTLSPQPLGATAAEAETSNTTVSRSRASTCPP